MRKTLIAAAFALLVLVPLAVFAQYDEVPPPRGAPDQVNYATDPLPEPVRQANSYQQVEQTDFKTTRRQREKRGGSMELLIPTVGLGAIFFFFTIFFLA
ncbi:MAG: hypothetical protein COB53_09975, partial [Elusimicrobia bacterium]